MHEFGIICPSDSSLNSKILSSDSNLQIPGYNFVMMNHPSKAKRGGVSLYCKCSVPLKVIDISYLQNCISFKVEIGDRTCNFAILLAKQKMNLRISLKIKNLIWYTLLTKAHF